MMVGLSIYVGSKNTRQVVGYFNIISIDPVNKTTVLERTS
jgi:hypothetical protein